MLLALVLLAGCAGRESGPVEPEPAPPVVENPSPAPAPEPEPATPEPDPAPAAPTLTADPVYPLAPPSHPLWAGPVAVVVENSPSARPQSGLRQADLVVETLTEAEITRFFTLFWSAPAGKIGPVRSARQGFVDMADAYNTPFAHVGGSAEALAMLEAAWGPRNLDEIYNAGGYFYRSADREAPHNVYTNTDLLGQAVADRGIDMTTVPTTARDGAVPAPGEALDVAIDWHRLNHARWVWEDGRYVRYTDGERHLDETGEPLEAVNLLFLQVGGVNRGVDLGWTLYLWDGGPATVLVAGHRYEGWWRLEPGGFVLYPAEGGQLPLLAPGQTWAHLITDESDFTISAAALE
nr:DUF3048 domain-containing protein [Symbiobacterium terraclitae]